MKKVSWLQERLQTQHEWGQEPTKGERRKGHREGETGGGRGGLPERGSARKFRHFRGNSRRNISGLGTWLLGDIEKSIIYLMVAGQPAEGRTQHNGRMWWLMMGFQKLLHESRRQNTHLMPKAGVWVRSVQMGKPATAGRPESR